MWEKATCQLNGLSRWLCIMALATSLANFRGYTSVYRLRKTVPWGVVKDPAIDWWEWLPRQTLPCSNRYIVFEVVTTFIPFFIGIPFDGSLRSPALHMSNWHVCVYWYTSAIPGNCSMRDLAGCSQWKCIPWDTWWRNSTIPRASWYIRLCLNSWYFSWDSMDFEELRYDHDDQGPQSGLYQMFRGRRTASCLNNLARPSACARSPCDNPNRKQLPPWAFTWCVKGDSSLQNTSARVMRVPIGDMVATWTSNSSWNCWTNLWNFFMSAFMVRYTWSSSWHINSPGWSRSPDPPSVGSLGSGHSPYWACASAELETPPHAAGSDPSGA